MKTGMLNTMASRMVSATRSKMLALCGVAFLLCSVTVSADEVMTKNADGTYVCAQRPSVTPAGIAKALRWRCVSRTMR